MHTLENLADGHYRLTADVKNPHPDRRSNDWWKRPVIEAGLTLWVNPSPGGYLLLAATNRVGYRFWVTNEKEQAVALSLLPHLELIPETLDSYLISLGERLPLHGALYDALRWQISSGHLTLDQVKGWVLAYREAYRNGEG